MTTLTSVSASEGDYVEIILASGKPYRSASGELLADHVGVSTWNDPRHPAPVVSVRHVDHYLPSMTAAEARQVAAALITAAGRAEARGGSQRAA
jgi:hypothetical protein